METESFGHILVEKKSKALFETLPFMLIQTETEPLAHSLGYVEAEPLVKKLAETLGVAETKAHGNKSPMWRNGY